MKTLIKTLLLFIIVGCSSPKELKSSFFVAGHTYGDPRDKGKTKGIYKPFKEKFNFINSQKKMKRGFFLGDVVWRPNAWPDAEKDISLLEMPIDIVRGNHDGPLKEFKTKFGESYKSFIEDENLFIVLDPNLDGWNISGEQLIFLKNTLRNNNKKVNNIFIFSHQVLWWSKDKYNKPLPNSTQGRDSKTNFWPQIIPLLNNVNKPVFMFAGDVGAFSKELKKTNHIIEYFYSKENNVTFISTGMGGGVRDNFVIVDVLRDGSVNFRLVHLNGDDINGLGKLKDYKTPN